MLRYESVAVVTTNWGTGGTYADARPLRGDARVCRWCCLLVSCMEIEKGTLIVLEHIVSFVRSTCAQNS